MRRTASQELNELRKRVDTWREQQVKRRRIPEELWDAAAQVAKIDGVWLTARETRFNYDKLLKLTLAQSSKLAATFVELPVSMMQPSHVPTIESSRAVIEMVGARGDRMRVDVGGGVDVVGLTQAFWGCQP